jgi:large subunit ribosomal protein L10
MAKAKKLTEVEPDASSGHQTRGTSAKAQKIDDLAQKLRESKGTVLLDYRGLTVAAIANLRRMLDPEQVEFHVTKNTLLEIAATRAEVEVAPDLLVGPTAVAFSSRDESSVARLLTEFVRRNRIVSIKGGVVGGKSLSAAQISALAELPGREILLSQLLGVLQAPLATALGLMQAPARDMVGLAQALADKMPEAA